MNVKFTPDGLYFLRILKYSCSRARLRPIINRGNAATVRESMNGLIHQIFIAAKAPLQLRYAYNS